MDNLNAHIDLGEHFIDFAIERRSVRVGLEPYYTLYRVQVDEVGDEDFTTDSTTTSSAEVSDDENEESMVVAIVIEERYKSNHDDIFPDDKLTKQKQSVAERSSHPEIIERVKLEEFLRDEDILAWSLHYLRSAEVPVQRCFELKVDS